MISFKYKFFGVLLIILGVFLTILYSVHRMDLSVPVFAIQSSYLSTKYFTFTHNNIFEELIILSYLVGFLMTTFSKEREEMEVYGKLRGEAWQKAILLNSALLFFATVFIFGKGFLMFLIYNLFSTFILFHLFFWLKKRKLQKL